MALQPVYWEAKDPDTTENYALLWAEPIAISNWSAVVGVVLTADSISADTLRTVARIAGGVNGVVGSLTNTVTTVGGEILEQQVFLPIVNGALAALGQYEPPRPEHLMAKYPAFVSVPYSTIAIHLVDARSGVDTSWFAADYAAGLMALAAHNMALLGLGELDETEGYARKGVTGIRDGAFSVQFSDKRVGQASGGGFDATPYGRQYKVLLRRSRGGPRMVGGGAASDGWGPTGIQNNGALLPWGF